MTLKHQLAMQQVQLDYAVSENERLRALLLKAAPLIQYLANDPGAGIITRNNAKDLLLAIYSPPADPSAKSTPKGK